MQDNARRPEGVRPSQGGKFVGFGSQPPPQTSSNKGVEDVTAMLSKGWSSLSQIAESAAGTASVSLRK